VGLPGWTEIHCDWQKPSDSRKTTSHESQAAGVLYRDHGNWEHHGSENCSTLRATKDILVLLVTDTIIKWILAALDKFGDGEGHIVKSKENFQGHFLPENILWRPSWPSRTNSNPWSMLSVTRMNSSTFWVLQDVSLWQQMKMKINGWRKTQPNLTPTGTMKWSTEQTGSWSGRAARMTVGAAVERIHLPLGRDCFPLPYWRKTCIS
jgi:hypothetical protein